MNVSAEQWNAHLQVRVLSQIFFLDYLDMIHVGLRDHLDKIDNQTPKCVGVEKPKKQDCERRECNICWILGYWEINWTRIATNRAL